MALTYTVTWAEDYTAEAINMMYREWRLFQMVSNASTWAVQTDDN